MLTVRLLRIIFGYVLFRAEGGFSERFLNLCALSGTAVWDMKSENGALIAKTPLRSIKKLLECAEKSAMNVEIICEYGLPARLRPYLMRKGLIVGALLCAVLTSFLTTRIWTVEVCGCEKHTPEQILAMARERGVYVGARKKSIDIIKVREQIKATAELAWFSVNMDGCHVTLEVTEKTGEGIIYDDSSPCNIVSGVDGEVVRLVAQSGEPAAAIGGAVTKGDLLISGVIESENGARFVHARGYAVIRRRDSLTARASTGLTALKITKIERFISPVLYSARLPLRERSNGVRDEERYLSYAGTALPVGIIIRKRPLYEKTFVTLTEEQSVLYAAHELFVGEKRLLESGEAEKKTVKTHETGENLLLTADYISLVTTSVEKYIVLSVQD